MSRPIRSTHVALAAVLCVVGLVVGVCAWGSAGAADSPSTATGRAICRTDSAGYCTVPHTLGSTPASAVLTPVYYPGTRPFFMGLASTGSTSTVLRIRAMYSTSSPVGLAELEFSYILTAGAVPTTTPPPPVTTTTTTVPPVTTTTVPPTTTTTTTPPQAGFPNASNTGTPAGTTFANTRGLYEARTPGEVLDKVHFTDSVVISVQGVTITNSLIDDTILIDGSGSVTVTDTTIGPPEVEGQPCPNAWNSGVSTNSTSGSYTLRRVRIQGHEDGLKASGSNMRVEDSYINACGDASDHSDGIQDYPVANGLVLDHNTFDDRGPAQNGAVYINAGDKGGQVSSNVTITNNLGLGGAYVFYLWPGNGTWIVTGNRAVLDPASFGAYNTGGRCNLVGQWADNDIVTANSTYGIASTLQDNVPCP